MGWATISDQQVDPESPVTSSLVIALRDNPIAIANADAGAPRNKLSSLAESPIKHNSGAGNGALTVTPFATASGGTIIHQVFVEMSNLLGEGQAVQIDVRIDGADFFSISAAPNNRVAAMRAIQTTNAQHVFSFFTFAQSSDYSMHTTIISSAA